MKVPSFRIVDFDLTVDFNVFSILIDKEVSPFDLIQPLGDTPTSELARLRVVSDCSFSGSNYHVLVSPEARNYVPDRSIIGDRYYVCGKYHDSVPKIEDKLRKLESLPLWREEDLVPSIIKWLNIEFEDVLRDVRWESFRAAGQSLADSEKAVRCICPVLGIVIDVSEHRASFQNREEALKLLRIAFEKYKNENL